VKDIELKEIVVAFLAIQSFIVLAYKPDWPTALGAVAAASIFAFQSYLERRADQNLDDIKLQLRTVRDKVEALMVARGLGR
jgi:hypothetical protein